MDELLEDFGGAPDGFSGAESPSSETELTFLSSCFLSCAAKGASECPSCMRALFLKVFNDFLKNAAFSGTVDA